MNQMGTKGHILNDDCNSQEIISNKGKRGPPRRFCATDGAGNPIGCQTVMGWHGDPPRTFTYPNGTPRYCIATGLKSNDGGNDCCHGYDQFSNTCTNAPTGQC